MPRLPPEDPGLPIKLGPCGNGEFRPLPPTALVREAIRRTNEQVEANTRRLGISRRQFLRSSLGAATTLSVLAACSREAGQTGGTFDVDPGRSSTTNGSGSTGTGGQADVDATLDEEAADAALGPLDEEFILDVQGHLLELPAGQTPPGFPQSACGEADPASCYSVDHFLELMFLESDTHMVVLSAIPFSFGALSPDVMERTIAAADRLGCQGRVLMQGESFPTAYGPDAVTVGLEAMAQVAATYPIRAFKTYTHSGGSPWRLDDDTGGAYLAQARDVGVPIVAVHKGLAGGDPAASPVDIGPAAAANPDISLLVYHSGYELEVAEGPYFGPGSAASSGASSGDEVGASTLAGVDRLIASVHEAGIQPGGNVYAELGSTWRLLMSRPDEAAHVLGKLLVHLGEDNILWGTDSIWYGSPQDQIQAFRTFQITEEFQERFGYPALTEQVKRKILGYNAAYLHGIDPVTEACQLDRSGLDTLRAERSSQAEQALGPPTRSHHTYAAVADAVYAESDFA